MKSFKVLLLIALIIVIGGMAALYGANYLENGSSEPVAEGVVVSENREEIIEPEVERDPLESGSYFIFSTHAYTSGYDETLNGYDERHEYYRVSSSGEVELIASIDQGAEATERLYAELVNEHVLLHGYQYKNQQALLNMYGEVVMVQTIQHDGVPLTSSNGEFQIVTHTTFVEGGNHLQDIVVTQTKDQSEIARFTRDDFGDDVVWQLQPIAIDDQGEYMYVRTNCGACSGVFKDQWEVNLHSGEIFKMSDLLGSHDVRLTITNSESRQVLGIVQEHEWATDGPYEIFTPPSNIELLDLDTREVQTLLIDEKNTWDQILMEPAGAYRYAVRKWGSENEVYIVASQDGEVTEDMLVTNGWLEDWVEDQLLVSNYEGEMELVNVDTKEIVQLDLPNGGNVRYIGSITIE